MNDYLIFSDLEGTLLRHDTHDFSEASKVLKYLNDKRIPLVLATTKTYSEVTSLQKKLNINCPFIVENGAGIFIPSGSVLTSDAQKGESWIKIGSAKSYLELRSCFEKLKRSYPIRGFGDMEVDEIIYLTSLDKESATHTKERDFTEPFVIDGEIDMDSLKKDAQAEGLDIVKGKRFYHLISQGHSKAKAMLHVASLFEKHFAMKLIKIALGDSENDFSMLKSADVGILIPSYSGAYADINDETIIKAPFAGPRGWNEALLEVLDV